MAKRPGLDKTVIAQTAGELADQVGFDNLTLSKVAEHLGVRTPSLYNHVEGLDGLRREVSLLAASELNRRLQLAAVGKAKDDALTSMLQAYRAFAKDRPGLHAATIQAPDADDVELQSAAKAIIDSLLLVLEPYHLSYDEAVHTIRGFRTIGYGFAALELAGAFGIDLETDESYERMIAAFLRSLKP